MKKIVSRWNRVIFFCLVALFAFGCGGGGSTGSDTTTIRGLLTDGPIQNGWVELLDIETGELARECGAGGSGLCRTLTDEFGEFLLQVPEDFDAAQYALVSTGGIDALTGVDFSPFRLRSDLSLFNGQLDNVIVSPLTTLLSYQLAENAPLADAATAVLAALSLPVDSNPLADPATTPALIKASLLTVKIVRELDSVGVAEPFRALAGQLDDGIEAGQIGMNDGLTDLGLTTEALNRIGDLEERLTGTAQDYSIFVEEELFQALGESVALLFPDTVDLDDEAFNVNGRELVRDMVRAAGEEPIPLNRIAPQRLARYALHDYGFDLFADLTVSAEEFAGRLNGDAEAGLAPLAENPDISELAALTSLYAVEVPLLPTNLLGNDNAARVSYYYQSDASPFYAAEQLVGQIADDLINDAILIDVVEGKSTAGLFDEARVLVETQIYTSAAKADGYLWLARGFIALGRFAEAEEVLSLAFDLVRTIVDSKGAAQLGSDETKTLYAIANNYRKSGNVSATEEVFDYLAGIANQSESSTIYGRLGVVLRDLVDDLHADGDVNGALAFLGELYSLAQQAPPNVSTRSGVTYQYYKIRVYLLEEAARRYAEFGDSDTVWSIYQQIVALRNDDGLEGLTFGETWFYMALLVDDLYRVGFEAEALDVADSIPEEYENYYGATRSGSFYQQTAYQSVVEWVALSQGIEAALPLLEDYFPDIPDRVEAMTYFATNRNNPNLAAVLIEAGRTADARVVLDAVGPLLAAYQPASDKDRLDDLIEDGYLKLARLYHETGDVSAALNQLQAAEIVLADLVGVQYRVEGMCLTADVYQLLGETLAAEQLLAAAWNEMATVLGASDPEDEADLLELIAVGYRNLGLSLPDPLIAGWLDTIELIFDPVAEYSGNGHDKAARAQIGQWRSAAVLLFAAGLEETAFGLLQAAESTAWQIFVQATQVSQLTLIVRSWTTIGQIDQALRLAFELPFLSGQGEALQAIAEVLVAKDDFPESDVARVDTDGDGQPDFWNPSASQQDINASGLVLDPDSDGDGLNDEQDPRPLYFDEAG
ncbi:MAG: hypothetical protein C0616_09795 [Desulfuromonas sp.]|nr:MAG: hypothetical protein C0616_09795 [Desulfuromonas sp.]